MKDREELVTCLERSVVEKQRQVAVLQRKSEDLAHKLLKRDEEISTHAELARKVCLFPFPLLFLSSYLFFSLLFKTNRKEQSKKKETVKHRKKGKPCNKRATLQGKLLPMPRPRQR